MVRENIEDKINSILFELQNITGVSDDELNEFKKILELTDFSEDQCLSNEKIIKFIYKYMLIVIKNENQ